MNVLSSLSVGNVFEARSVLRGMDFPTLKDLSISIAIPVTCAVQTLRSSLGEPAKPYPRR